MTVLTNLYIVNSIINDGINLNFNAGNSESLCNHSNIPSLIVFSENINCISEDPLFRDDSWASPNLSLQGGSPCIDTGISDIDGDGIDDILEYYGAAPDMGAYEMYPDAIISIQQTNE